MQMVTYKKNKSTLDYSQPMWYTILDTEEDESRDAVVCS